MTDLAKLVVRLEAETAKYQAELEKAKKQLLGFQKVSNDSIKKLAVGVGAAAVAAATGLAAMVKQSIDAADEMSKLAQSTGISTRTLSELAYAGDLAGVSQEELAKSLAKLSKTAVDAAQGGKAQADAFKAIGVAVKDSSGAIRAADDILLDIADRFAGLEDGAAKAALAQDLFGKSGAKLIPFLNQGRAGIEQLREEARKLGVSLSDEAGKQAEEFNDNITRLKTAVTGIATQLAQRLLPHLVELSEKFLAVVSDGEKLDTIIDQIVTGMKILATAVISVNTVFQVVGKSIGAVVGALSEFDLNALDFTSPAALIQGIARNSKNAGAALGVLKEGFVDVGETIQTNVSRVTSLWEQQDAAVKNVTASIREASKEQLKYGTEIDPVQEVAITAQKIDISPMEEFYRELDEMTATSTQKAVAGIEAQKVALEELRIARRVTDQEYAARLEAIKQAENDALGITEKQKEAEERRKQIMEDGRRVFEETRTPLEKYNAELVRLNNLLSQGAIDQETFNRAAANAKKDMEKAAEGVAAFFDEAKRNAQDILGQGIYDIMDKGFEQGGKAALKSFKQTLDRLAAEAAAAQIWKWIFGDGTGAGGGGGGGGSSGLTSGGTWDFFKMIGGIFGGTRDSGGRGRKGMAYAIGREAQPELFIPDTSGTFIPKDQWMGGGGSSVTQNIYVQGKVDQRSARQLELEASRRQNVAKSRLG